tara:strand:- start:5849 stop:6577 length:729 start_codon:yes stop_codon:yes gene_type:complete
MRFSVIFFIFILASCSNGTVQKGAVDPYTSSGFALIYNENDYKDKIISGKLNDFELEVGHSKIKKNSIVKITNPENKKSLELKVSKNIKYPDFFKIIISKKVGMELGLSEDIPFVDIEERIKNKSFVAKKAVTFSEEQKVSDKAPVTKVKINDISEKKETKTKKVKKFTIIVGEFYSEDSAKNLRDTLEHKYVKKGALKVKKVAKNNFRLSAGPYSSINTLKKRYFELNKYGFEDLDIKQND